MARGIGARAFQATLIFSVALSALSTGALFVWRYKTETGSVAARVEELREAQTPGIAASLWSADGEQLKALVEGMHNFPYVSHVAVKDEDGNVTEAGSAKAGGREEIYALTYSRGGRDYSLGSLVIETDQARIVRDIARQVLLSLALQAILLVLASLFVLVIFDAMVTRHLGVVAAFVGEADWNLAGPPLVLRKRNRGDELDILAGSFNDLRSRLLASRDAERAANAGLARSEERYRILVEEAPDAILMTDAQDLRILECNRRAEELFGRRREEIIGRQVSDFYVPRQLDGLPAAESAIVARDLVLERGSVSTRRLVLDGKGGSLVCELRLSRYPDPERKLVRASYLDVTERVRAEEAMERSLREKDILLQEIYHRTKNNMQVIASLLDMNALFSEDEELRRVLKKMTGRIQAMSLVHQKLYESKDLSRVDLKDYVEELVSNIALEYLYGRSDVSVTANAEAGLVCLLDTAIPCGLVINELLVNAITHAFPERRVGKVAVSLARGKEGGLRLSVADDGIGLSPGFDPRIEGGLGLRTVISIVEYQLKGRLELRTVPNSGVEWVATFRDDLYGPRV